jgi:hypothetical protein
MFEKTLLLVVTLFGIVPNNYGKLYLAQAIVTLVTVVDTLTRPFSASSEDISHLATRWSNTVSLAAGVLFQTGRIPSAAAVVGLAVVNAIAVIAVVGATLASRFTGCIGGSGGGAALGKAAAGASGDSSGGASGGALSAEAEAEVAAFGTEAIVFLRGERGQHKKGKQKKGKKKGKKDDGSDAGSDGSGTEVATEMVVLGSGKKVGREEEMEEADDSDDGGLASSSDDDEPLVFPDLDVSDGDDDDDDDRDGASPDTAPQPPPFE